MAGMRCDGAGITAPGGLEWWSGRLPPLCNHLNPNLPSLAAGNFSPASPGDNLSTDLACRTRKTVPFVVALFNATLNFLTRFTSDFDVFTVRGEGGGKSVFGQCVSHGR